MLLAQNLLWVFIPWGLVETPTPTCTLTYANLMSHVFCHLCTCSSRFLCNTVRVFKPANYPYDPQNPYPYPLKTRTPGEGTGLNG